MKSHQTKSATRQSHTFHDRSFHKRKSLEEVVIERIKNELATKENIQKLYDKYYVVWDNDLEYLGEKMGHYAPYNPELVTEMLDFVPHGLRSDLAANTVKISTDREMGQWDGQLLNKIKATIMENPKNSNEGDLLAKVDKAIDKEEGNQEEIKYFSPYGGNRQIIIDKDESAKKEVNEEIFADRSDQKEPWNDFDIKDWNKLNTQDRARHILRAINFSYEKGFDGVVDMNQIFLNYYPKAGDAGAPWGFSSRKRFDMSVNGETYCLFFSFSLEGQERYLTHHEVWFHKGGQLRPNPLSDGMYFTKFNSIWRLNVKSAPGSKSPKKFIKFYNWLTAQ